MDDQNSKLQARIDELESRIEEAIETLHCLANESVHRSHGCPYAEIDYEDMDEVIAILKGKDQNAG